MQSNPGGKAPLGNTDKLAAAKAAKDIEKSIKLANIKSVCGNSACNGDVNINASNTAITKIQKIKKITAAAQTVTVTSGASIFAFPNVITTGNLFVSHTVHTDADNPLNVIDPNSTGVIDCDVATSDSNGGTVVY